MKTAVMGEDPDGFVVYNRALLDLARHYGFPWPKPVIVVIPLEWFFHRLRFYWDGGLKTGD